MFMFVILRLRWPYTLLCNKFVISSVCKYDIELLIIKVIPHLSCLHVTFKARTLWGGSTLGATLISG